MRHELGIDLYEYIRGERPWSQLYRFLVRLPVHGHFHASVMADEESIEQLKTHTGTDVSTRPPLLGWSAERDMLATIIDVLSEMHATLIQVNTKEGRRPSVVHMRRPESMLDKIELIRAKEAHDERVKKFLPRG